MKIVENGQIQGSFVFQSDKHSKERKANLSTNDLHRGEKAPETAASEDNRRGSCYFAMYYPYGCDDLSGFIQQIRQEAQ